MLDDVIQDNTEALEVVAAIAWAWTSFSFTVVVSICCPWTIPFTLYHAQQRAAASGNETAVHRELKPKREPVPSHRVHMKAETPVSKSDRLAGGRSEGLVTGMHSFLESLHQMVIGSLHEHRLQQASSNLITPSANSTGLFDIMSGINRSARWLLEQGPRCSGGFGACDALLPEKQQRKGGPGGPEKRRPSTGWDTPTDDEFSEGDGIESSSSLSEMQEDELYTEEEEEPGARASLNEGADLPAGWEIRISHSNGRAYFCNRQSGQRRWTVPHHAAAQSAATAASSRVEAGAHGARAAAGSQGGGARRRGGEGARRGGEGTERESRGQGGASASHEDSDLEGLPETVPVGAWGGPGRGSRAGHGGRRAGHVGGRASPEAACHASWSRAPCGPPS